MFFSRRPAGGTLRQPTEPQDWARVQQCRQRPATGGIDAQRLDFCSSGFAELWQVRGCACHGSAYCMGATGLNGMACSNAWRSGDWSKPLQGPLSHSESTALARVAEPVELSGPQCGHWFVVRNPCLETRPGNRCPPERRNLAPNTGHPIVGWPVWGARSCLSGWLRFPARANHLFEPPGAQKNPTREPTRDNGSQNKP